MHAHLLFPIAALAGLAVGKPLLRRQFIEHEYHNATISLITYTSADDSTPTGTDSSPTCTASYIPTAAQDCYDVALQYGVQLSEPEASYDVYEDKCKVILSGYGVCIDESSLTTSAPAMTASSFGSGNATISSISIANMTSAITVAAVDSQTLTYTQGIGSASKERVVVVTHTTISVMTETTTLDTFVTSTLYASDSSTAKEHAPATATAISTTNLADAETTGSPTSAGSCATAPAPAITQDGVTSGCAKWYVAAPGDYCLSVAQQNDIAVDTFMDMNPAVGAPHCNNMLAGSAYCVESCDNTTASTSTDIATSSGFTAKAVGSSTTIITTSAMTVSDSRSTDINTGATVTASSSLHAAGNSSSSTSSAPTSTSTVKYVSYNGNGSTGAGWPTMNEWVDFETMFASNEPQMKSSCAQWGVPDDSDDEVAEMKSAIQSIASNSSIDERFVLAIIMQESTGCVRVITTSYSVLNPGLMQSHNGTGSCNLNNVALNIPTEGPYTSDAKVQTPCPNSEIVQMIKDGTQGTASGDGLMQIMAQQKSLGYKDSQAYYRTARGYNGGSIAANGNLSDGCCTKSYASDVANRLLGWVDGPHTFTG